MQLGNTLFRRKVLSFTLIQVAILSFLLIVSVAVRVMLYPHNYLEPVPMYCIVGFFFLGELFQFFLITILMDSGQPRALRHFRRGLVFRILFSILVGVFICFFLTGQHTFFAFIFLFFLFAELIFNVLYYKRFFNDCGR